MTAIEAAIPEWTLGDRIRRARTHKGLEQADVATALGVSRSLVSMWERDLSEPRVGQVREIADLTGVPLQWLLNVESSSRCNPDSPTQLVSLTYAPDAPEQVELPFSAFGSQPALVTVQ